MSLVLVNGCLEPGADGVGDYCRRLAASCRQLGVPTSLLALNDPHVAEPQLALQQSDGLSVPSLRLPASLPWRTRTALAAEQLQTWRCSALSLQFVPYAFDRRGLPLALLGALRQLLNQPGLRIHWMLHEIWIGIATTSDLRSRSVGHIQRRLIQSIGAILRPDVIHTTNSTYACCLKRVGIDAGYLPLFSNLPPGTAAITDLQPTAVDTYSGCIFGRIPPPWDPDPSLQALVDEARKKDRKPRLLLVGRQWIPESWFESLRQRWPQIVIDHHGIEDSTHRLRMLISACQLGLAPVPWGLIEKSGAAATFLSLGLPVVASNETWQLRPHWHGSEEYQLPNYSNLMRLSAWRNPDTRQQLPRYTAMTPRRVAEAMLPALLP